MEGKWSKADESDSEETSKTTPSERDEKDGVKKMLKQRVLSNWEIGVGVVLFVLCLYALAMYIRGILEGDMPPPELEEESVMTAWGVVEGREVIAVPSTILLQANTTVVFEYNEVWRIIGYQSQNYLYFTPGAIFNTPPLFFLLLFVC